MEKQFKQVQNFLEISHQPISEEPKMLSMRQASTQFDLGMEELLEYQVACVEENLVKVLDSLVDQAFILFGTVLKHGLKEQFEKAFDLIYENNMQKAGEDGFAEINSQGKVLKPEGFKSVDLLSLFSSKSFRIKTVEEFEKSCKKSSKGYYICGDAYFIPHLHHNLHGKSLTKKQIEKIFTEGSVLLKEPNTLLTLPMITVQ